MPCMLLATMLNLTGTFNFGLLIYYKHHLGRSLSRTVCLTLHKQKVYVLNARCNYLVQITSGSCHLMSLYLYSEQSLHYSLPTTTFRQQNVPRIFTELHLNPLKQSGNKL